MTCAACRFSDSNHSAADVVAVAAQQISYWARTTIVTADEVLAILKPRERNAKGVGSDELFLQDPKSIGTSTKGTASELGLVHAVQRAGLRVARDRNRCFSKRLRARAIERRSPSSRSGSTARRLGAIYPPMANTYGL